MPIKLEEYFTINHWKDLKDLYITSPDFSDSVIFKLVFNVLILWKNLGHYSRVHKYRLKEIKDTAKSFYRKENQNKDEVQKRQRQKPGILPTFYFLFHIMQEIEVISSDEYLKTYFPIRPPCMMISTRMKLDYREKCCITDSSKKMTDLMQVFKVFSLSMVTDLEYFRSQTFLYHFASREAFDIYEKIIWCLGFLINCLVAWDLKMVNGRVENDSLIISEIIESLNYILLCLCGLTLFLWTTIRYEQNQLEKEERFRIEHPYRNPDHPIWSAKIT